MANKQNQKPNEEQNIKKGSDIGGQGNKPKPKEAGGKGNKPKPKTKPKQGGKPNNTPNQPIPNQGENNSYSGGKKDQGTRPNDWSWYAGNEQLARLSGEFSYYSRLGIPITKRGRSMTTAGGFKLQCDDGVYNIPGILVYSILPTIGRNRFAYDTATISASSLFSFVNHALGKKVTSYERSDLFMTTIAASNIYALYAEMMRVYALTRTYKYSELNRYMPDAVLTALGYDADDFRRNIRDFRQWLVTFASRVSTVIWVPKDINYFKKMQFINESLYADNNLDTGKAQLYVTRLAGYYKWTPVASETGSSLTMKLFKPKSGNLFTYQTLTAFAEELLNAMVSDQDFCDMAADIRTAYGKENLVTIPDAPDDFSIEVEYSLEILTQLQNAESLDIFDQDDLANFYPKLSITQSGNIIISDIQLEASNNYANTHYSLSNVMSLIYDKFITVPVKDPTFKDNLVNLQYMINVPSSSISVSGTDGKEVTVVCSINASGAILANIKAYTFNENGNLVTTDIYTTFQCSDNGLMTPTELSKYYDAIRILSAFDYHPAIKRLSIAYDGNNNMLTVRPLDYCWDFDNMTNIPQETLEKIINECNLALIVAPIGGFGHNDAFKGVSKSER